MNYLPAEFAYLRDWAEKFGVRGLTIYNSPVPYTKYAAEFELDELRTAYETIANRGDLDAVIEWCHSVEPGTPANDAREAVRGLLLLFERLAEYELLPFTDGCVRYVYPAEEAYQFVWERLPAEFAHLIPWLKKFEHLRSEAAVYNYAADATDEELVDLKGFKELLEANERAFSDWCEANSKADAPATREAFQAEWMFLLVDFATWERNGDGTLKFPG